MNYRKAVYHALLNSYQEEGFLSESLSQWKVDSNPSQRDFSLAYEIAFGTMRRTFTLDAIAKELSKKGKLQLKLKEKVLVRMALYQAVFMKSMPLYAIGDQMVDLAKSVCHPRFIPFFNAILHALDGYVFTEDENLSRTYSFPKNFIDKLCQDYPQQAVGCLKALNQIPIQMMRVRKGDVKEHKSVYDNCVRLASDESVKKWADDPRVYIQNVTPFYLISALSKRLERPPAKILDVCSAPGGKTIALHDIFPKAELWANEKSPKRIETLEQNLEKYSIHAHISNEDGLTFHPSHHFDLVVLDVPCSNTGVLGKKPEARLRLSDDHVNQLKTLQLGLLKHAAKLVKKTGFIWYLTCSILKEENEELIAQSGLKVVGDPITILPNDQGWDGGFGAILQM